SCADGGSPPWDDPLPERCFVDGRIGCQDESCVTSPSTLTRVGSAESGIGAVTSGSVSSGGPFGGRFGSPASGGMDRGSWRSIAGRRRDRDVDLVDEDDRTDEGTEQRPL